MNTEISPARRSYRDMAWKGVALLIVVAIGGLGLVFARSNQAAWEQQGIEEGLALAKAGRPEDAETRWRSVLSANPDNPLAWEMLAKLYIATRRFSDAIGSLQHLAQLKPETPGVYSRLAECERRIGNDDDALKQDREALKRDPNDISALVTSAMIMRNRSEGTQELAYERRLAQVQPNNPDFLLMLAGSLMQYGSYTEALPLLDKLVQIAPDRPNVYSLHGEALYYIDQTSEGLTKAEADFRKALQLGPNAFDPEFYLGLLYIRRHQPDKAIPYLLRAKCDMPSRGDADFVLAEAYTQAGRNAQAEIARRNFVAWREEADQENELEKRLALRPADFEDNLKLGEIKLHKRETNAAAYYLNHALQLQPANAEANAASRQLASQLNTANAGPPSPSGER